MLSKKTYYKIREIFLNNNTFNHINNLHNSKITTLLKLRTIRSSRINNSLNQDNNRMYGTMRITRVWEVLKTIKTTGQTLSSIVQWTSNQILIMKSKCKESSHHFKNSNKTTTHPREILGVNSYIKTSYLQICSRKLTPIQRILLYGLQCGMEEHKPKTNNRLRNKTRNLR